MSVTQNQLLNVPVERGVPQTGAFDSTLALLREGYSFIQRRCALLDSDVFTTRLTSRRVVCACPCCRRAASRSTSRLPYDKHA